MKNPRLPVVIMVVSLVAVAFLALRAFTQPYAAKDNSTLYTGRGDYQRFEAQLAIPDTGSQSNSPQYNGRGDYQRYETRIGRITGFADLNRVEPARKAAANPAASNQVASQNGRITGFADLNRVDSAKQAVTDLSSSNQSASQAGRITGFADLNRVASQAVLPQTGGSPAQSPAQGCPHLSTPAGERDAGASAPAYVLQAMGCQAGG